ncbi:MAG TPA: hypothetical protein VFL15_08040 [Gammaproteobacteria bacterium]|nr:hypothetical protein [Gammaproteobacteria bacterium]
MTEHARDLRLQDPEADARMVASPSLWRYLPSILLYPLRGYALGVVLVMGLLFWMFDMAGIYAAAMGPITLGWLTIYLFMIVEETALGHAIAPPLGTEVLNHSDYGRILMVIGFWLVTGALGGYLGHHGLRHGDTLCMLAGMLLFPAFLVTVTLAGSVWSALNPMQLMSFIYHTGTAYLMAVTLLCVSYMLIAVVSGVMPSLLAHMLTVYFLVMSAHLLGFVTYHRHERLGLDVMVERPTKARTRMAAQQRQLDETLRQTIELLETRGWDAARELLRREPTDLVDVRLYHEELYEALRLRRQYDLSLVEGKQLIRCLVLQKRLDRALDIYEQCLDVNSGFEPESAADRVLLAECAFVARRWELFKRIVADVPPVHAADEAAVSLRFLQARYLSEIRHQDSDALMLLNSIMAHVAHPRYSQIKALHGALQILTH